ncbi:DUF4439 domain-containing protein [Kitasatospora sp. NBC_01300]|uniref:ferritin-like domain-containing protein n=1 Tax=Kitasatospora sp. NBC_01300 TaxID=2903574 RepID=UPI00352C2DA0|nr:DUF4439 domain-containing protein [Kitasatospora sp. NBC_01300]
MQPPSRRTYLALGLLALTALTACTGSHGGDGAPGNRGPLPNPDEPVILRSIAATDTLLAGYDALLAGPGGAQAAVLQPLRAEVAQHRAALAYGLPAASVPPASPATPSTTPPAGPGGTPSAPPSGTATGAPSGTPVGTPAALAALERQTAQARLADLAAARPPLARLLASVAASDVLHAVALGDTTPLVAPPPAAATPTEAPTAPPSDQPTASPSAAPSADPAAAAAVTALQGALGAEHAAVYGYGVVGARLPEDQQRTDARTAYAAHEARRDAWQRLIGSLGAAPAAAAAGYQLPFAVTDTAGATKLAAHLETRLTAVYADLVAAVPGPQRGTAADALRDSALRAHRWGAADPAFPGIPEPLPTPTATTP